MTGLRRHSPRHNGVECCFPTRHCPRSAPVGVNCALLPEVGRAHGGRRLPVIWSCASIEPVLQECAQKRRLLVRQCVAGIVEYRKGGVRIVFE